MRRAIVAAIALALLTGGTAAAAARPPIIAGSYTYSLSEGMSAKVVIDARGGAHASGWLEVRGTQVAFGGPVLCVNVDGSDAVVAGTIDHVAYGDVMGTDSWWIRVTDNGAPASVAPDYVVTFMDFKADALAACESFEHAYDDSMTPVLQGNVVVRP